MSRSVPSTTSSSPESPPFFLPWAPSPYALVPNHPPTLTQGLFHIPHASFGAALAINVQRVRGRSAIRPVQEVSVALCDKRCTAMCQNTLQTTIGVTISTRMRVPANPVPRKNTQPNRPTSRQSRNAARMASDRPLRAETTTTLASPLQFFSCAVRQGTNRSRMEERHVFC